MQLCAARLAKRQKCGCGENLYANDGCKEQALRSRLAMMVLIATAPIAVSTAPPTEKSFMQVIFASEKR